MIQNYTKAYFLVLLSTVLMPNIMWGANTDHLRKTGQDTTTFLSAFEDQTFENIWNQIDPNTLIKFLQDKKDDLANEHYPKIHQEKVQKDPNDRALFFKEKIETITAKTVKEYFSRPENRTAFQLVILKVPQICNGNISDIINAAKESTEISKKQASAHSDARWAIARDRDLDNNDFWAKGKIFVLLGTLALAGGSGTFFGLKNLFEYWKEKALVPPFCQDTNDESMLTNLMNWVSGKKTGTYIPGKDKLFFDAEQKEIVDRIKKDYVRAMEYNLPCPHYLFYGPPGTGKTTLALQLATETDSTYYIIKASAFLEKDGPRQFRQLMSRVRETGSRPIIFIDEADELLKFRSEQKGRAATVFRSILEETGGNNNRICTFIFTTNTPDRIDPAMKDRLEFIQFKNPSVAIRQKIIKGKLKFYFEEDLAEHSDVGETIDYSAITPDILKIAAEKTKDWSCRSYGKLVESLRRLLLHKESFECTAQNLLDHIDQMNANKRNDMIAGVDLRDQFTYKGKNK